MLRQNEKCMGGCAGCVLDNPESCKDYQTPKKETKRPSAEYDPEYDIDCGF